jgi:protein TonB
VLSASLLRSSGHRRLDEAARTAVLRWRFTPARRNGLAIPWTAKLPIRFRVQ